LETACPPTAVIPAKAGIQYAGAYRLNHWRLWNTGSSAFADDDSRRMTQLHDLAARFARGLLSNFLNPPNRARAQGMPGARCTRGLVCNRRKKYAHEHTGQRRHPTFPAQWLYGLYRALPGRAGLVVTVAREKRASHELDASIGASGPHGLMSSAIFGSLKTPQASENRGVFRFPPDKQKTRPHWMGPIRP
jgi:hypothetical protein